MIYIQFIFSLYDISLFYIVTLLLNGKISLKIALIIFILPNNVIISFQFADNQ